MAETKPEHSPLGASSYSRWKACPGSIRLSKGIENKSSSYADRGTYAHGIAAKWLETGSQPPNDLDPEELDAVQVYVDYVQGLVRPYSTQEVWSKIEHRFDLTKLYPELYGTADAVIYNYNLQKLVVIDYKHGAGIPVEVETAGVGNSQLTYYGLGAMYELGLPCKSIELVVVQPRCFHRDGPIRKFTTTSAQLLDFLGDLIADADLTKDPNAPLRVGDHCRFCPAAAVNCPAVREKSLEAAKQSFSPTSSYNPEALADTLDMLPTMDAWIKGVREFAYQESQHGRIPPRYKVVAKRATRQWKPNWTGERIAQQVGLKPPEVFDTKLRSPAQIEKLIPKSLHAAMELLVDYESSGSALVSENDSRPSIGGSVKDVFSVIE
jgi:Protein of unknown function (DUF2800)